MPSPHLNRESRDGLPLDALDPRLTRLHTVWSGMPRAGALPSRRCIDPLTFRGTVGHVTLVDVEPPGAAAPRFRIRLLGERAAQRMPLHRADGRPVRYVDEIVEPEMRERLHRTYLRVVREAVPSWATRDIRLDHRELSYDAIWLPFGEDGATVDTIQVGLVFHSNWP